MNVISNCWWHFYWLTVYVSTRMIYNGRAVYCIRSSPEEPSFSLSPGGRWFNTRLNPTRLQSSLSYITIGIDCPGTSHDAPALLFSLAICMYSSHINVCMSLTWHLPSNIVLCLLVSSWTTENIPHDPSFIIITTVHIVIVIIAIIQSLVWFICSFRGNALHNCRTRVWAI